MDSRALWARWLEGKSMPPAPVKTHRHKYGAEAVWIEGIPFDSKREAARYQELRLLLAAGQIKDLEIHPGFPLQVVALYKPGPPWVVDTIGMFHADFRYLDLRSGEVVIEDVKSDPTRTTAYKLRKRIAEAVHGITVREIY